MLKHHNRAIQLDSNFEYDKHEYPFEYHANTLCTLKINYIMNKNNLRSKQEKNQLYPDFHLLFRSQQHCEIIILKKIIKNKKTTTTSQANIINHATELMKLKMKQQKKRNTNSLARLARRRRERKRKTEMAPVSRRLVAV